VEPWPGEARDLTRRRGTGDVLTSEADAAAGTLRTRGVVGAIEDARDPLLVLGGDAPPAARTASATPPGTRVSDQTFAAAGVAGPRRRLDIILATAYFAARAARMPRQLAEPRAEVSVPENGKSCTPFQRLRSDDSSCAACATRRYGGGQDDSTSTARAPATPGPGGKSGSGDRASPRRALRGARPRVGHLAEDQKRFFEAFLSRRQRAGANVRGSGIGLSLVKHIAESTAPASGRERARPGLHVHGVVPAAPLVMPASAP